MSNAEYSINDVSADLDVVRAAVEFGKRTFKAVVANTEIPLEDRWQFFLEHAKAYGERNNYIIRFDALDVLGRDAISYDGELMHTERHEDVVSAHIVERLEEAVEEAEEFGDSIAVRKLKIAAEGQGVAFDVYFQSLLNTLKEEILKKALYSYNFDW